MPFTVKDSVSEWREKTMAFQIGEKVLYRPNGGVLEVLGYRSDTNEYVLAPSKDSETGVMAKAEEVEAIENDISDLELLKQWVELLRVTDGRLMFGNDTLYTQLARHRKGAQAFEIAFHAVYGVQIPEQATRLIFDAVEGLEYWMREAEKNVKANHSKPTETHDTGTEDEERR